MEPPGDLSTATWSARLDADLPGIVIRRRSAQLAPPDDKQAGASCTTAASRGRQSKIDVGDLVDPLLDLVDELHAVPTADQLRDPRGEDATLNAQLCPAVVVLQIRPRTQTHRRKPIPM